MGTTAALHLALNDVEGGFSLADPGWSVLLYLFGLAMPTAVAIALTGRGERIRFLRECLSRSGPWWLYLLAASAQFAVVLGYWAFQAASGLSFDSSLALGSSVVGLAVAQVWVVFGEELGWRGYALPRLLERFPPRVATLVLSAVWGIWHAPMFFVAGSLQAGESPVGFAASIFAWSTIHTFLYSRSRPSVLPSLLFHASANITLNVVSLPAAADSVLIGIYLVTGCVVLVFLGGDSGPDLKAESQSGSNGSRPDSW